jgi:hypothetical protein
MPARSEDRFRRRRQLWTPEGLEPRVLLSANPTYYTVNLTSDTGASSGTGDPSGDLLWAITQANANTNPAGTVIDFDPTVFATPQTITLSCTLELSESAGPEAIDGPSAGVVINGNNAVEVVQVDGGVTGILASLTISGGSAANGGGIDNAGTLTITGSTIEDNSATAYEYDNGGGVYNTGTLAVSDSTIVGNSAAWVGGGILDEGGTLTVTDCTIDNNLGSTLAQGAGGGIAIESGTATVTGCAVSDNSGYYGGGIGLQGNALLAGYASLTVLDSTIANNSGTYGGGVSVEDGSFTISDSTIVGNSAAWNGGGISNGGVATVIDCTIDDDSAGYGGGGGVANGGTLSIIDSTIAGNTVAAGSSGGGVYNAGALTAVNTTIAYNQGGYATTGGGMYDDPGSTTTLYNTIVAANTGGGAADDIDGTSVAGRYDLVGVDNTGSFTNGSSGNTLVGATNPGLELLANNGGPTQTIALLAGSPAIGAGMNGINGFTLFTDQRGYVPPTGVWDIGAYQLDAMPPAAPTAVLSAANVTPGDYGQTSYTFGITFASNAAVQASTLAGAVAQVVPPAGAGGPISATVLSTAANGPTDPSGNAQSFTVTYQITPPGGSWSAADDGTYSVTLGGAPVTDVDGTAIASGAVGSFAVQGVSTTTTTVVPSASTSSFGQVVTFAATITANAPGSGTPTGSVDFFDTTTSDDLGSVTLSGGKALLSTTSLPVGGNTIKVSYSGDGNFVSSFVSTGTITIGQSIIVLDPTAGGALSLAGNASIKLSGGVFVDSGSSTALSASGNAAVKASVIDVHGGVQKSGNASFSPAPVTGAAVLADPLASLAEPSTFGLTNYGSEILSGNSSATIKPGIYSHISVSGNGTLTMDSGIYLIEGGGFSVSGNASVSGSGVMIFNAGSKYPTTGGSYGGITLSGNGSYNLSPPTTGTYAGIVIFQSRDNSTALSLSGNASGMTGTVYAPAAQLAESGNAQLNAAVIVDTMTISGNGVSDTVALSSPAGTVAYTPAQIRTAYGMSSLGLDGTGQTIAIVDAYDDPEIDQALDTFDSQFGLTASGPTLYEQYGPASSFLTVLNQYGQATSLPSTDPNGPGTDNWEVEESLDVEWAHAVAPGAQIILVEADSQSLSDLMSGVATAAAQPGVSVVSMSWGFAEGQAVFATDEAAYDRVFNVPGVTFVASTGDYGAADPEYPAFSPNVVAVGGTSLTLNGDGSYNNEAGWGYYSNSVGSFIGSGGGISLYEPEPAYQKEVQSTGMRTTPDVSLVADPATGAWIADPYNLDPSNPFEVVGGTSLSAPAWAGLLTLANQGRATAGETALNSISPTDTQQDLYMLPQSDFNAITSGSNGYAAGTGYNLVTGLGTPAANLLVPDLAAYQGPGTSYSGSPVAPLQDASLVDTGSTNSGPIDVFNVFDSITVTHAGQRQKRSVVAIDSPIEHASAPAVQSAARTTISAVDQVLQVATDESPQETLIGDLAFEQVSNGPRKRP